MCIKTAQPDGKLRNGVFLDSFQVVLQVVALLYTL